MNQRAFTLVELSIVLVILGLLIGGVLTGQSLIRAAELRSVTTQFNSYLTATQTFRDKYMGLPGDLTNAQSYWGIAHATPATCVTTASTDAKTCNGDGNGRIDASSGAVETFRFWQHLANAGLIEGSYSGISQGSNNYSATNANSPAGKVTSTLWSAPYRGAVSGVTYLFDGEYGNTMQFGGMAANNWASLPVLKPEEAYNVDMKIDDGKPAMGKVVIFVPSGFNTCTDAAATASGTLTANYLLTNTALSCGLAFRQLY